MNKEEKPDQKGVTVKKSESFSEWYTQIVEKSKLAEYGPMHGTIVFAPNSYEIWENVQKVFDQMIKGTGHRNAYFPLMIPESLLKREAEHFKAFVPEVFWVTHEGDNKLTERYAIRPTSETIIYYFFSKWLRSWRDLPILVNQWCSVVRAEIKDTKPFMRNSEFLWQEGHTAHENGDDAAEEVMLILDFYRKVMEEYLAIPVIAGRKSESEKFGGAEYTATTEAMMPDGKALQMGTSHNLGQHFSKSFGLKFIGRDDKEHLAWTTSWGFSTRLLGAMIMTHGDDSGLVMPPRIAYTQVVIVPIYRDESQAEVMKAAKELSDKLKQKFRVTLDSRGDITPGYKFNDWELKGVPLRIEIGPKDIKSGTVVLVRRDTKTKKNAAIEGLEKEIEITLEDIQKSLYDKAKQNMTSLTSDASDYNEFQKIIESKGGFVRANWCGKDTCELKIKSDTGATNRVIPFDEKRKGKCVVCGEVTETIAYFAKAY